MNLPNLRALCRMGLVGSAVCAVLVAANGWGRGDSAPDLVGTWVGDYRYASENGIQSARLELRITHQDGELVRGLDIWEVKEGDETRQNSLFVAGVLSTDGKELELAENGGFYRIRLVSPTEMHATFLRTNQYASAFRAVLRKK